MDKTKLLDQRKRTLQEWTLEFFSKSLGSNYNNFETFLTETRALREKAANDAVCSYADLAIRLITGESLKSFLDNLLSGTKTYNYSDIVKILPFLQELSIVLYYTSYKSYGFDLYSFLLTFKPNLPDRKLIDMNMIVRNSKFYGVDLPVEWTLSLQYKTEDIRPGLPYKRTIPSIIPHPVNNGQFIGICKSVNWTHDHGTEYRSLDADGKIRTNNIFIVLDKNMKILRQQKVVENLPRKKYEKTVLGQEDCILFFWQNQLWFTCTTFDTQKSGVCQISICRLSDKWKDANYDGELEVELLVPLEGPNPNKFEKNWIPFVEHRLFASGKSSKKKSGSKLKGPQSLFNVDLKASMSVEDGDGDETSPVSSPVSSPNADRGVKGPQSLRMTTPVSNPDSSELDLDEKDDLKVIYFYDPIEIYKIETDAEGIPTGKIILDRKKIVETDRLDFTRFRGSAGPVKFSLNPDQKDNTGFLTVTHEVVFTEKRGTNEYYRDYFHRFVYWEDYMIKAVSPIWYIKETGVQFCRTFCPDGKGNLLLGLSLKEEETVVAKIDYGKVRDMLKPIVRFDDKDDDGSDGEV